MVRSRLREATGWEKPVSVKLGAGRIRDDIKIAYKDGFDYVVIDGPSILTSCDASIIHDSMDAVVMVVRSGVSRNREVRRALDQISADMVAGMVLMDSPTS